MTYNEEENQSKEHTQNDRNYEPCLTEPLQSDYYVTT